MDENKVNPIELITNRIAKLEEIKASIGEIDSNSARRYTEWIESLIKINHKWLKAFGG